MSNWELGNLTGTNPSILISLLYDSGDINHSKHLKSLQHTPSLPTPASLPIPAADHSYFSFSTSCNHWVAKDLMIQQLCLKSLQHIPSLPTPAADHSCFSFSTSKTRKATQWQITDQACPVSKAGLLTTFVLPSAQWCHQH